MKIKKVLISAVSVVMAATSCLTAFSGCGEHQHSVSKWTVNREATCIEEGERQGNCTECGDVVIESIPVDSTSHVYGEWDITVPSDVQTGKAVKCCTLNPEHEKLEVELPVISDEAYEKTVLLAATPLREGRARYTLSHEEGDITFEVTTPIREIKTALDAIEVACALSGDIRSVEGKFNTNTYNSFSKETMTIANEFSYEFGDNYTHIQDGVNDVERWCSEDEEGVWCFKSDNGADVVDDNEQGFENYINGYRFVFTHTNRMGAYYGAENFLAGLYAVALNDSNGEPVINNPKVKDGVLTCTFSFYFIQEYHTNENNKLIDGLLSHVTVTFTLKDTYELDTLNVQTVDYQNVSEGEFAVNSWKLDVMDDGSTLASIISGYEYDESKGDKNKATVIRESLTLKQTSVAEAEELGLEVPVNPYNRNSKLATSYDVYSGSDKITDDFVVTGKNTNAQVTLKIDNLVPETADLGSVDQPTFWLVTESGEVEIDYSTLDSRKVNIYYTNSTKTITLRSKLSGEVTILMKTKLVTKQLKFNFTAVAPTKLYPYIDEYYEGNYTTAQNDKATIYVGQSLFFTAKAPTSETTSADSSFTATVTSSNSDKATIVGDETSDVKIFSASAVGSYTIKLTSAVKSSVYCTITVTVVQAPEISSILSGTYTGNMVENDKLGVTVKFLSESEAIVSLSDGSSETLAVTVNDGVVSTKHKSGAELNMSLVLNDAYDLILENYSSKYDNTESIFLKKA